MKPIVLKNALILTLFAGLITSAAFANYSSPTEAAHQDASAGATRKLGRGIANVGLGWVELFKGIQSVNEEKGFWAGVTWGPLFGAMNAVQRTAVGVGETLTFPAPGPNKYEPVLYPEFVMEKS